jgi:thiamine transport system permease protein
MLIFIFDFTSFGVILILGGPQFNTIETAIYRQTLINFDLPMATALALVQLACTFAMIVIYTRLQNRAVVPLDLRPRQITQQRPTTRRAKWLLAIVTITMLSLLLLPLLALVVRSFVVGNSLALDNYFNLATNPRGSVLFVPPLTALGNSLLFAIVTTVVALIIGTLAAYASASRSRWSRLNEPIWALPLGASAVTLGFGFLIGFPTLRSSWIMIPLAHSLVAFPFVVRAITPALRSIRSNLREAAAVLGADPSRVWREIDLPILGRAMLIGGAFAFAVSLGEFGATAMLARAEMPTLPYAIFRYLSQPGSLNYGQAMAMSTVLMLVVALSLVAIDRFRLGEIGEF